MHTFMLTTQTNKTEISKKDWTRVDWSGFTTRIRALTTILKLTVVK